jgi:hypothetical protein
MNSLLRGQPELHGHLLELDTRISLFEALSDHECAELDPAELESFTVQYIVQVDETSVGRRSQSENH